jgi:hypothetical protein
VGDPYFPLESNGGYDVGHYRLDLAYDPAARHLDGTAHIIATATQNLSRFDLDLSGLTVRAVQVNSVRATFHRNGQELQITPRAGQGVPARRLEHERSQLPRRPLALQVTGRVERADDDRVAGLDRQRGREVTGEDVHHRTRSGLQMMHRHRTSSAVFARSAKATASSRGQGRMTGEAMHPSGANSK